MTPDQEAYLLAITPGCGSFRCRPGRPGRGSPERGSTPGWSGRPRSDGGCTPPRPNSSAAARRQVVEQLPEAVAAAAFEFIVGPLLDDPHRIGKRLRPPLGDRHSARRGTYRVVYRIDENTHTVTVLDVAHRRDAYRTSG